MYGVMEGEEKSIMAYLKHIWGTPLFNLEIETYKTEGRNDVISKWTEIQRSNAKRIQDLEDVAHRHPYSPELYYNLHLLYTENGNKEKANENLQKAKIIDPSLQ